MPMLCFGYLKEHFKCPCLFLPLCNRKAAQGQGAGNHGSGAEGGDEEVVFKWVNFRQAAPELEPSWQP
jgi:hypothetical protein